jgi:hypothetical protein
MSSKFKTNAILAGIVITWLTLLFIFIDFRSKAAGFILPIFTIFVVIYLAYLTFWGVKKIPNLDKQSKDKQSESEQETN